MSGFVRKFSAQNSGSKKNLNR